MPAEEHRSVRWWWVFPLVPSWIVVSVLLGLFLPHPLSADRATDGGFYITTRGLLWGLVVPKALALVVPIAAITVLGWWGRVNRDSVPTARWVIAVPILVVTPCVIFTRYDEYLAQGAAYFSLVVLSVLLIALSEELMFRGLVVEMLRCGLRERWVALISTLLFALVHLINGGGGIPIAISAVAGGYLYYLTRRAAVFLVFPILVHAAFDLFGFSQWNAAGDATFYMFLYQWAICLVVLGLYRFVPHPSLRARRRAEQPAAGEGPAETTLQVIEDNAPGRPPSRRTV